MRGVFTFYTSEIIRHVGIWIDDLEPHFCISVEHAGFFYI